MYSDAEWFLDDENGVIDERALHAACNERKLIVVKYGYEFGNVWHRTSAIVSRKDGTALYISRRPYQKAYAWSMLPTATVPMTAYFGYPEGEAAGLEDALDQLVNF